ncbi:MAG: sugar phosphate isomerase/epimerase [Clostridia bacterium]|nr:sugar phosphate isomerase/epimerase [Clostridia bacterium]
MQLSVSSYSFSQYIRQGKLTQLTAIQAAYDIGLRAIEFIDLTPPAGVTETEYAKQLRAEANRLGMTINAYTITANLFSGNADDDAKEVKRLCDKVDVAAILGAPVLRHDVCWSLEKGRSFDFMLPTIANNARAVTEYAATLGIRTCTENHGYIAQDSDRMEKLVLAVNHPNYGLLVDIGNFACADEDSVNAVSRVAQYAFHVHAKDFIKRPFSAGTTDGYFQTRECNYLKGTAVGEGDIPVKQCVAVLNRAGYTGYLSIEYEGTDDCLVGIKTGFDNLTSYINEICHP